MSQFEIKSDLPDATQKKIDAIEAIPVANRTATQVAFLLALAPYLTNLILSVGEDGLITGASGLTVPTGYPGFRKGAIFIKTDAAGNGEYMNVGSTTVSSWDLVDQASTVNIDDGAVTLPKLGTNVVLGNAHEFYVDGSRTDTYTATGNILTPFKTIKAAQDAINITAATLYDTQAHFELCKFIIHIAPGKYTDALDIQTVRYLQYDMKGVEISGNIDITQSQLGLSDYYGKVEFVGGAGNRPYRGNCGLISGDIAFHKAAYDSLAYDGFIGINVTGNVSYGTTATPIHGTWVLCLENAYFGNGTKFIEGHFLSASEHLMIESYGYNKILSHLSGQDGSAVEMTLYDCNNTYFDLVNILPIENCTVKNCTFNSTTSIVAVKNLYIDSNSYKSLTGASATLTGMTPIYIDEVTTGSIKAAAVTEPKMGFTRVRYWDGSSVTLQSLITAITDADANSVYTIVLPPGKFTIPTTPLLLKPYVNLRGAGGRGRTTILSGQGISLLDAACSTGVNRFRMDGIRMESCPVNFICTTSGKTLVVTMDDCPCNGSSPINTEGEVGGAATTMVNLELRDMNVDCNSTTQKFKRTKLYGYGCSLLGLYFENSEGMFQFCDIGTSANVVSTGSEAGWFEFNGCRIASMTGSPDMSGESVLATLCGAGTENVTVNSLMHGASIPTGLTNWDRINPGAMYYMDSTNALYVKTGIIGSATWEKLTA